MPDFNSVNRHIREAVLASLMVGEPPEKRLSEGPRGYLLVYGFNAVDSDICNGGFRQVHQHSTWAMMPLGIEVATIAGAHDIARVLREAVIYFHQRRWCRMPREVCEQFSVGLDLPMTKRLPVLDDEYFALHEALKLVVERFVEVADLALWEA